MTGKIRPMAIRDILAHGAQELKPRRITCAADHDLGRLEAEILLAHILKKDRVWLHAHDNDELSATNFKRFRSLVSRRKKHEPIAYILGHKDFYGHTFLVDNNVLIPRPESEMLVELAVGGAVVWDVGTGSGAIALAIAKQLPNADVLATDISSAALTLAKKNAKRLKTKNIIFLKANLLDAAVRHFFSSRGRITMRPYKLIIVANLPYLPETDKSKLSPDVLKYEPAAALFAGKDGLKLIEKFLRQLASYDIRFTSLFLEYDPPQTKKLRALTRELFPKVKIKIHKDLAGRDRVLEMTK